MLCLCVGHFSLSEVNLSPILPVRLISFRSWVSTVWSVNVWMWPGKGASLWSCEGCFAFLDRGYSVWKSCRGLLVPIMICPVQFSLEYFPSGFSSDSVHETLRCVWRYVGQLLFFPSLDRYASTEICLGYMFVNYVFSMNVFLICLVLRAVLRKYLFVVNFRKPVGVTKRIMFNFTV